MQIIITFFLLHWSLSLFFHSFFLHRFASHQMYTVVSFAFAFAKRINLLLSNSSGFIAHFSNRINASLRCLTYYPDLLTNDTTKFFLAAFLPVILALSATEIAAAIIVLAKLGIDF